MFNEKLPDSKGFFIGCNYWASHAGTAMWSDWRPDVVEDDLRRLSEHGLQVLRVFPLWPDFQPIDLLYTGGGQPMEYRFGEEMLPDDEAGRSGVCPGAISKFEEFVKIAEKHGFQLIVGLVTGYMSGRLFVPPALRGRNILTDPTAILWQVRFVKYFVNRFKHCDSIIAWDLGNECNVMQSEVTRDEAWVWTAGISNTIRSADASRPVVSGMHSLSPQGTWRIQDQGELTDILTTHPYPIWTPHCDADPLNTVRPILHACAESRFYEDIGKKPCFAEEMGTMGPMIADNAVSADFARASIFSLWAHNCHGALWWCANEQSHLDHAPYGWNACEGELGLFDKHGHPKPVLKEMGRIRKIIDGMPFKQLPERKTEAVCLLNSMQDHWAVALGAFILSKQAGFDLKFAYEDQQIGKADLYIIPCIKGWLGVRKHAWQEILGRVGEGASLYLSLDDGFILDFSDVTGLSIKTRSRRSETAEVSFEGIDPCLSLNFESSMRFTLEGSGARVLGREDDGNIAFSEYAYGKGKVYFLSFPMETDLIYRPGVISKAEAMPYWRIYEHISEAVRKNRVILKTHPHIGITEHPLGEGKLVAVLVNLGPEAQEITIGLREGWQVSAVLHGEARIKDDGCDISFPPNDAVVLEITGRQ